MKKTAVFTGAVLAGGFVIAGKYIGIGPLKQLRENDIAKLPGNAKEYDFAMIAEKENSPLKGKKIAALGSSVTYGAASNQQAVGEYLARRYGAVLDKEALSATTLADVPFQPYVRRIRRLDRNGNYALFICQLSTNDAARKIPLGEISEGTDMDSLDLKTVTGALEYIILYAKKTWNCPAVFYTGSRFDSPAYDAMVRRLYELQNKYDIGILDLWNDTAFNDIPETQRKLYMHDPVHPTKAGYRDWWGPEMEKQLDAYLKEETCQKQES